MGGGGGGGGDDARQMEEERQAAVEAGIAEVDKIFASAGSNLYDKYRKTYENYYTPQLQEQGLEARKNIGFDAARRGMTESSSGIDREADFTEDYNEALTTLANQAQNAENQYRTNVAGQKQNLYSQVQAGMNPATAANLAQSTYNTLAAQTPELSPLGDLFSKYANLSSMNMGLQSAGYQGLPTFRGTGMVNPFGNRGGTSSIK